MKNILKCFALTTLLVVISYAAIGQPDTVLVNFGNSSRIIFQINEPNDINALKYYDLNSLVNDMTEKIANDSTRQLNDNAPKDTIEVYPISNKVEDEDEEDEDFDKDFFDDFFEGDDYDKDKSINHKSIITNKIGDNTFLHFDVGVNNFLENGRSPSELGKQYAVRIWGSWYVAINSVFKSHISDRFTIAWGGGLNWYNFKFEDHATRFSATPTGTIFTKSTDDVSFVKSKLTVSYLNITALPMLKVGNENKVTIGLGGYAGYKLTSYSKYVYRKDGDKEKDKSTDGFNINSWRYGLRLQIGIDDVFIFVNYDLNPLFVNGKGPDVNAFSIGVTF